MSINIKNYDHIIWDWNGTLLNDVDICVKIMNDMLLKRGKPAMSHTKYEETFTFPVRIYYQAIGWDFEEMPFEQISDEFIGTYEVEKYNATLQPNARKVLQSIHNLGIKQSIISASKQDSLHQMVISHKLTDYFCTWRGLNNHHAHGKIDIGKQWMKEYAKESEKIIMIGDTIHDKELAQALGIETVLLHSGHQSLAKLKKAHHLVINNLLELI